MSQTRALITIQGRVQGVGFRPFIYRLAHEHGLLGTISNTCIGVKIDVQGEKSSVLHFQQEVINKKPPGAAIIDLSIQEAPLSHFTSFEIAPSESQADKSLALLPDTALCTECLKELFDPQNRRYHYPFLHCISCGPRFSLFLGMPFDRERTTMREFSMCAECRKEYNDPTNRRFYSQTNCCPNCGPQLQLLDAATTQLACKADAFELAAQAILKGKIVAMKNTGGYLLLADATNEEAVQRLRLKKRRPGKPFALLMPSLDEIENIAHLSDMEGSLLTSSAAPIVLLTKKGDSSLIAPSVSQKSLYHGVMLAHNPLQHLLLRRLNRPLVATSGNLSGSPLCITEEEAFAMLSSVADYFLVHNRRINHRLDDSIVQVINHQPTLMRKARGYIPCAFPMPQYSSKELFAAGSQMKNSFAFLKQGTLYMSQHMGDLDSAAGCRAYENEITSWESLLGIQNPEAVSDKHPDFYSSTYLKKRKLAYATVQHHEAHVWAGMLDNKITSPFLGISWDGTGWGDDGTIWGGEAFLANTDSLSHIAGLYPFRLPGGEKAVREPRRALLGLLHSIYGHNLPAKILHDLFTEEELSALATALSKKINAPICSSIGRLFDAVSALLGFCLISDFEGEAAMLLEKAASQASEDPPGKAMPLLRQGDLLIWDHRPMIEQLLEAKSLGVSPKTLALSFHKNLALSIVELAKAVGVHAVLLTGGVMQNKLLVELATAYLKDAGFKPYTHREIPPNDGGIGVGQLIAATHCGVLTHVPSLAR